MLMADGRLVWCGDFCVVNVNVMVSCSLWSVKKTFCGKVEKNLVVGKNSIFNFRVYYTTNLAVKS